MSFHEAAESIRHSRQDVRNRLLILIHAVLPSSTGSVPVIQAESQFGSCNSGQQVRIPAGNAELPSPLAAKPDGAGTPQRLTDVVANAKLDAHFEFSSVNKDGRRPLEFQALLDNQRVVFGSDAVSLSGSKGKGKK